MEVNFIQVDRTEIRFDYKGKKFLLQEKKRGVYSAGLAVQLHELQGVEKIHVKEIGWTKTDNYGPDKTAYLPGIVTMEECKTAAVKYIDLILG